MSLENILSLSKLKVISLHESSNGLKNTSNDQVFVYTYLVCTFFFYNDAEKL